MIGIREICSEIPPNRLGNASRAQVLGIEEAMLSDRIGFSHVARRFPGQETSNLCVLAAHKLLSEGAMEAVEVQCVVVVTQNPDGYGIPHTAAVVQRKLGLPESCASFDVGLGGSGYVYGLSVAKSFMESNELRCGLLFTADPYSRVIDELDPKTSLLFGDAATVTLLTAEPMWSIGRFVLGTAGAMGRALEVRLDLGGRLHMNEDVINSFALERIPASISSALQLNGLTMKQIDRIILHQGGRALVEAIAQKIGAPSKVGFHAATYGDTVSSSVPILLQQNIASTDRRVLLSGFGSGLSWATTVLTRVEQG